MYSSSSSLLVSVRTSTVANASMISSTHNLPPSSFLQVFHFLMYRINKINRDFLHWQIFSLVRPRRNHATLFLSHQF